MKKLIIPGCVCIIGILLLSGCNQQFRPMDPEADIKMDINEGAAPLTVQFKGDKSYDSDGGDIVSYFWDFGDGSTSTLKNPSHTFERDGGYSIRLMVTDDEGVTDNETDSVYVFSDESFSSSRYFGFPDGKKAEFVKRHPTGRRLQEASRKVPGRKSF